MKDNVLKNLAEESNSKQWQDLPVGGMTPFTTIDFPNRLAAVVYTQGCAWKCRYCHNTELRSVFNPLLEFEKLSQFLKDRKGKLDAIVFSGGEATLHKELPSWMGYVKEMGYEVGLHTSGMFSDRLKNLLPLCDWIGMDVKAPFDDYEKITLVGGSGKEARKSAQLLLDSGVDYEFRTTVHPDLLSEHDIINLATELEGMGAKRFVVQAFQPEGCTDERLNQTEIPVPVISESLQDILGKMFDSFEIRQ